MAQNLDPNLNDPTKNLSRNDVSASNDDLGENTEQTPVAQAQNESARETSNERDERIHTVTPDEDDGIRTRNESEASASVEKDERIPTVTPYNENGIAGPDDDDDDEDDTLLDDDDDEDDYEEIVPIEGDDDDLEDEYDDDDDDDEIEDRTNDSELNISRVGVI